MISPKEESILYGIKLSSVGPAKVTGSEVVHEPTSMDLAMKLHYLRGVYYFSSQTVEGLTMVKIKETMFSWFNHFYMTCGRFRRSDTSGRPYIKCNDCGARIIEANCSMTLLECLDLMNVDASFHKQLVPNQVIGPELGFSPPLLLQVTWFKCGGMSLGLSYAHVLGNIFSASNFINMWGKILAGHSPNPIPNFVKSHSLAERSANAQPISKEPVSLKRVDPVGDHWVTTNNCKMGIHSFRITAAQLGQLQSKISGPNEIDVVRPFECLCAIFWKCIAQIREGSGPNKVTVCRNENPSPNNIFLSNSQIVCPVEADLNIKEAGLKELATLLVEQAKSEHNLIESTVEIDPGTSDFIVYGANLTFANWEDAALYGLEIKGQEPVVVNYTIDCIGDDGVVLVLPGSPKDGSDGNRGRTVTAILPENEVVLLKAEMSREWSIV